MIPKTENLSAFGLPEHPGFPVTTVTPGHPRTDYALEFGIGRHNTVIYASLDTLEQLADWLKANVEHYRQREIERSAEPGSALSYRLALESK